MARLTTRIGVGTLGLLAGLGAPRLVAQSWALPASDPVSIARSGTGVAYGNSLEAAGLNPALLATLRDGNSAYLALGLEMEAAQTTLQSNQQTYYSSDRSRSLPAMGAAWRLSPDLVLGLKLDEPFLRHSVMPLQYTGRFAGQSLDLNTHRLEGQLGLAVSPNFAVGASLGVTRVQYSWDNMVRTLVANPNPGAASPILGQVESDLHQEATKIAPSYSFGFRWAPNSRWTLGGSYVGAIRTTMPLSASYGPTGPQYFALTGYPRSFASPSGQFQAGSGGLTLPGKATLGVRQRVNQLFTWELDVHYIQGAQTQLPGYPSLTLASGTTVSGAGQGTTFRNGVGGSVMGELNLGKRWVVRLGAEMEPALRDDSQVDPLLGGAKSSGFSTGFGYKCLGGEVNAGYQYRQSQDVQNNNLDGAWPVSGYTTNPTQTRVEGMGHLLSIGYKRSF